ncbi:magnesium transporter [bacterium]|nr:magnesium transporter [bacterium]
MSSSVTILPASVREREERVAGIHAEVRKYATREAVDKILFREPDGIVADVLSRLNPSNALKILSAFDDARREKLLACCSDAQRAQWERNRVFPEGSIGRMMEMPAGILHEDETAEQAVAQLREMVKKAFITYLYVVDSSEKLVGLVVMRDLLLADKTQRLGRIMLRDPFSLRPNLLVEEAMKEVITLHYPVYPVCDDQRRILGLVRGQGLFEQEIINLTIQAGSMVGVEKEERLTTPWSRSLKFRGPWLQINLLTAFLAAAVVGVFQDTIDKIVVLAAFLPVMAGQSGNAGCQALAVTLRGMALGELSAGREKMVVIKEAWLGFLNGLHVGVVAAAGMYIYAVSQHTESAATLGIVAFVAMVLSCVVSGIAGAMVPIGLQRLGTDPATASSIFLTTATDVVSMGVFLGLATWLIL